MVRGPPCFWLDILVVSCLAFALAAGPHFVRLSSLFSVDFKFPYTTAETVGALFIVRLRKRSCLTKWGEGL